MATMLNDVYQRKVGGSAGVVGGLDDLSNYSVLSKVKRDLIREIAKDIRDELKIKEINPNEKDIAVLIKQLKRYLPDPRPGKGNKRTFNDDKNLHKRVCASIAKIVNSNMGAKIVDPEGKPAEVCERASEVIHSLFVGIHGEFLSVRGDVTRSIRNLRALRMFLAASYKRLVELMAQEDQDLVRSASARVKSVHEALLQEVDRQLVILQNILSVTISPAEEKISKVLADGKEFRKLVKAIKKGPGTGEFGEKLSFVLSGVGTTAIMAQLVDNALKTVGLSVKDYAGRKDLESLKNSVNKILEKKLAESTTDELIKFVKAADVLYKHDYKHSDIVAYLSSKKKVGGAPAKKKRAKAKKGKGKGKKKAVKGGLKLDKRIKKRKELRKALLRSFNQRLGDLFDHVLASVEVVVKKIGTKIPISDDLRKFVKAFESIDSIGKRNIYYALTGYHVDVRSRELREKYVSSIRYLVSTLDTLLKRKEYADAGHFRDMRDSFNAIVKLIDEFSDRFSKDYGVVGDVRKKGGNVVEKAVEAVKNVDPATLATAAQKTVSQAAEGAEKLAHAVGDVAGTVANVVRPDNVEVAGAEEMMDEEPTVGGDVTLPEITKLAYTLERAQKDMAYFYRVAKIYDNLKKASGELKEYGADYDKLLGDAVAASLDNIAKDLKSDVDQLEGRDKSDEGKALYAAFGGDSPAEEEKKERKRVIKLKKEIADCKKCMYKTAEAIDKYMQEFTNAVVSNPQDLKNVKKMLEGTEIISKWFTNRTGDFICKVFEKFPGRVANNAAEDNTIDDEYWDDKHYYEAVREATEMTGAPNVPNKSKANTLPGNPYIGIDSEQCEKAVEAADKAVNHLSALKNVVSTFVSLGDRFGGEELRKKTFMTPFQIYKNLVKYMKCSAFVMGLNDNKIPSYDLSVKTGAVGAIGIAANTTFPRSGTVRVGIDSTDARAVSVLPTGAIAIPAAPPTAFPDLKKASSSVAMNSVLQTPFRDEFKETDRLFVLVLKAMVAKILTAVGVFNVFNKPIESYSELLSDTRLILGGAPDTPTVVPDAIELYIRLPLLAEFYRNIFQLDSDDEWTGKSKTLRKISMVPEMEGVFAGLINLVFDKTRYVVEGTYSTTDVRQLVEEINKIYMRFKDSKDVVGNCITEFIAEMNRRYGVVKREEREEYVKERNALRMSEYREPEDIIDYEILPGGEGDDYRRPAPSDRYLTSGVDLAVRDHKHRIELDDDQACVAEFRRAIEREFARVRGVDRKAVSFDNLIKSKKEELKYARTNDERFDIVVAAINGFGAFAVSAIERTLLLFHETVVVGLNTLSALCTTLEGFRSAVFDMAEAIDKVDKWAATTSNVNLGGGRGLVDPSWTPGQEKYLTNNATLIGNLNTIIGAAGVSGADDERRRNALRRYIVRSRLMLLELVESLFAYDSDLTQVVRIRMSGNSINVDHSKLRDLVEKQMSALKGTMNKFRGIVPKKILDKYESFMLEGVENKGSLYYLEKYLMDELILGKGSGDRSIERSNQRLKTVMDHLTREYDFTSAAVAAAAGAGTGVIPASPAERDDMSDTLAELIYYNNATRGLVGTTNAIDGNDALEKLFRNTTGKNVGGTVPDALWDASFANKVIGLYEGKTKVFTATKSVVLMFNQLLAKYLRQFFDSASDKIYLNVINNFANGVLSQSVNDYAKTLDDMSAAAGATWTPPATPDYILLKSLAGMLQHLVIDTQPPGTTKRFLENSLAEIPLYMKENYRANMPIFHNMLSMLVKKAELVKMFVKSDLRDEKLDLATGQLKSVKPKHTDLLDQVIQASQGILNAIEEVLRELDDSDPKYLETYKGFISDYKGLNGRDPLMPQSSMLWLLRNGQRGETNDALPFYPLGSAQFKLMYGSRLVLSQPSKAVSLDKMPGMKAILQMHNESSDMRHHVSAGDLEKLVVANTELLRYLVNAKAYRGEMTTVDTFAEANLVMTAAADKAIIDSNKSVYSLRRDRLLSEVISITESSFQDDSRRDLVRSVLDQSDNIMSHDRSRIRIYNLIDLNVMPINIHALMREIPLINVYNYAHTFDKMVTDLFGVDYDALPGRIGDATDMMGYLLLKPHGPVSDELYKSKVARIIRGDTGMDLGRPKFLGDELYNKCLFGELYGHTSDFDEAGPGVGAGLGRGASSAMNQTALAVMKGFEDRNMLSGLIGVAIVPGGMTKAQFLGLVSTQIAAGAGPAAALSAYLRNLVSLRIGSLVNADLTSRDSVIRTLQLKTEGAKNIVTAATTDDAIGAQPRVSEWVKAVIADDSASLVNAAISANRMPSKQRDEHPDRLIYLDKEDGKVALKSVDVDAYKEVLQSYGKLRFDTKFVRNIFFVVNLQRALRLKLRKELMWYDTKIISNNAVVSPEVTELYNNKLDSDYLNRLN